MLKGFSKDAVYYALIIIFLGFTLYFLSPALFRQAPANPGPSIITTPLNYTLVNLVILTSSECKALCDYAGVEAGLKRLLVNVNTEIIDLNTPTGRALAQTHDISVLPAYIFDSSLEKSPVYNSTSSYFRKSQSGYVLNTLDALSGYVFAAAPPSNPEIVQFITSYDANSLLFQNKTFNVLKRFNNSINFTIRYAVSFDDDDETFSSINNYTELIEDAVQLCAFQIDPQNGIQAAWCRSRDLLSCLNESKAPTFCAQFWKVCVEGWGINGSEVEQCVRTQNNTMLAQQVVYTMQAEVVRVPTTFIGGKYKLVGPLSEFELFSTICAIYPSLEGCAINIAPQTTVNPPAANASVANSSSTGSN